MTAQAFDWIQYLSPILRELDQKPQFGSPLPFPAQEFERELKGLLQDSSLALKLDEKGWEDSVDSLKGLAAPFTIHSILLAPLKISVFLALSHESVITLIATLLNQDKIALRQETSIVEGFYTYFLLEIMSRFEKLKFAQPLEPRLDEKISSFTTNEFSIKGPCYVVDVTLTLKQKQITGRLLIPQSFRSAWKSYYVNQYESMSELSFVERDSKNIPLEVSLNVGQSEFKLSEWQKVRKGDFIVLDHCSYDPLEKTGRIVLMFKDRPLFRAKIQEEGGIKLLEYPFYEEVKRPMARDIDDFDDDDDDDDFFSDFDDDDDDDIEDDDDLKIAEDDDDESPVESRDHIDRKEELTGEERTEQEGESSRISAKDIPVQLTVEVGRIQLSAYELMQLQPGNTMELQVSPEQGVQLYLNGKHVGRGELIRMGEVLGVRILKI